MPPSKPFDPLGLENSTIAKRYRLDEFITSGGIAVVYKGVDIETQQVVAVKVLDARAAEDTRAHELKERFHREADTCTELKSPHTIRMFAHGTSRVGMHYMVLEWLEGETLHERMRSQGTAEPKSLIRIMKQLCIALAEAHQAGIVHRDLKPGNVLLIPADDGGDFAKLLDFGLAKDLDSEVSLTRAGSVMGTPTYMSPEQIEGAGAVDQRTDIYALGVMMFRGLTNKRPFGGKHATEVMQGHLRKPVPSMATVNPDIEVPRNLEYVVRTCMNKAREDRFTDVDELRLALRACELQLDGEFPGLTLTAVNGKLELDDALRARLGTPEAQPTATPAPARRTEDAPPAAPAPSLLWMWLAIGGFGLVLGVAAIGIAVWAVS